MARSEQAPAIHGLLLVDKPEGMTSAAVVARVKRLLGQRKVGHLGTLDPFATGLLPVCLGEGTKIAPFLADDEKRYVGEIVLGVSTDTLDRTGSVVETRAVPSLRPALLAGAVARFRGDIQQTPPMYSALKRDGVPLYRLARAGKTVERAPRSVRIARFDVAQVATDRLRFAVTCSKGTYIRVLAQDLGATLGTAAHLHTLRRTGCGSFDVRDAIGLEDLARRADAPLPVLAPSAALAGLRAVVADERTIGCIRRGQQHALGALGAPRGVGDVVRVASAAGDLVAIAAATADGTAWQLARVWAPITPPDEAL